MKYLKKLLIASLFVYCVSHSMVIYDWMKKPIDTIRSSLGPYNNGTAEFIIGLKWYDGVGVPQSFPAALKFFLKASEMGHIGSYDMLSRMYAEGQGVTKDILKSAEYEKKAAELGNASAQYSYGVMLANGVLGKDRYHEGIEWVNKSAAQGYGSALTILGEKARDGIDDFGNKIEPDYEKAFELFKKAAAKKSHGGMFNLAQFYQSGLSGKKNRAEAQKLFNELLNSQDESSFNSKALMYETGSGVARNLLEAKRYYTICAEIPFDVIAIAGLERVNEKISKHEEKARELIEEEEKTKKEAAEAGTSQTPSQAAQGLESSASEEEEEEEIEKIEQPKTPQEPIRSLPLEGKELKEMLNKKLSYEDKSIITDIDSKSKKIIITDPSNNSTVAIVIDRQIPIKQQKIKTLKKFNYDDQKNPKRTNVKEWLELSREQLIKEHTQEEIDRHRFAQRVDEIVQCYGDDAYFAKSDGTLVQNKILEGSIKTKDNRVLNGTFEYSYYRDDSHKKILYHRFLHPHSRATAKA